MKNIYSLSNEALHANTVIAASSEKTATLLLLEHLTEIDRRRLYAVKGYSSLWLYVNQALGYSETQASERVSAMRLIVKIPEVKKELEAGNISLTTTAKLAAHVRREKTDQTKTTDLLKSILGKSSREVDRVLASESSATARPDQLKMITSETVRITIDVDQEFVMLMNKVRELKGHLGSSSQDLFKIAMQDLVKHNEVKCHAFKSKTRPELPAQKVLLTPSPTKSDTQNLPVSRYIPLKVRHQIRLRSGDQCEYIDSISQHRCNCKIKLEFDHIIPFSVGGLSNIKNLRHYCSSHNKLAAIRYFGRDKMQRFLKN